MDELLIWHEGNIKAESLKAPPHKAIKITAGVGKVGAAPASGRPTIRIRSQTPRAATSGSDPGTDAQAGE
jgi:hypothetical protein